MPDQAAQLRKLVRVAAQADPSLAPGGPIVAVSGGRGEMGATTVACQLARELARLGKQVVVIDANLLRPAVAQHFDADPRPDRTIDAILPGTPPAPTPASLGSAGSPHATAAAGPNSTARPATGCSSTRSMA